MKIDFKSRGFIIIISIFFAFIFWAFVMADSNTTRVEDVRNVPIHFRGADALSEKGLVITGKSKDSGSMRIEGGVNVVGYITVNNVNAYVDLSNVTEPGEYELAVNTYCNNGSVVVKSFSPSKIKLTVEQYVEKEVPVEIIYDKDISDNYWIDDAKAQNDRVIVGGGQSIVQKVARATVNVNTDMLVKMYEDNPNHRYEASLPVTYVDENNMGVGGLNGQSSIVSIDVMSKKTVKVDVQGAVIGEPAAGYSINNIEQSVNEIDIVGKKDIIENINSLSVEAIDIEGTRTNLVSDATIKPIDGVTLVGSDTVKVSVNIRNDNQNQ